MGGQDLAAWFQGCPVFVKKIGVAGKSGHAAHPGRPGHRGGSAPSKRYPVVDPTPEGVQRYILSHYDPSRDVEDDADYEGATRLGRALNGEWEKRLDISEREAIEEYTDGDHETINSELRDGQERLSDPGITESLNKAIRKNKIGQDIMVYREVDLDFLMKTLFGLGPGSEFVDHGFTSTTLLPPSPWGGGTGKVNILCPKGTRGAYLNDLSSHKDEQEFLLPSGTRYRLLGQDFDAMAVTLEVVGQ